MTIDPVHTGAARIGDVAARTQVAAADEPATAEPGNREKAAPLSGGQSLWTPKDAELMNRRGITDEDRERYRDILEAFHANPANRENPQGFLSSLSKEDLSLLADVRSWGAMSKLDPATMNKEEATNFILPDTLQVDLNDDGLVAVGNGGRTWRFPPPNAPQAAKDAWAAATAGIPEIDRMMLELSFMPLNIKIDANGKPVSVEPGSPEWKNPYADAGFSYQKLVMDKIESLEFSRRYNDSATIDRMIAQLNRFSTELSDHGVV